MFQPAADRPWSARAVRKLGLKLLSEAIPRVDVVHSGALILGADAACRFVCIFGRT